MFSRADQLRIEQLEGSFKLHCLQFYWDGFDPKLLTFNTEDEQLNFLDLDRLDLSISTKKMCVGSFSEEGYIPCNAKVPVGKFTQCSDCGESVIKNQECIFEPECDGTKCDSPICREEHAVYIAFFGNKPKVGMTVKRRVPSRLIEQGADAYCIVNEALKSRISARECEKDISGKLKITERPSSKMILESLKMPEKKMHIEEGYNWLSEEVRKKLGISIGQLHILESYPLEEPLTETPKLVESFGLHIGDPVGVKGKFLIYKQGNKMSALNLKDLPSRFISLDRL